MSVTLREIADKGCGIFGGTGEGGVPHTGARQVLGGREGSAENSPLFIDLLG